MRNGQRLRLLGALLVLVGLRLGAVTPGTYISQVGLAGAVAALFILVRGRPPHLLPWARALLLAVALQAFGPLPGLLLAGGTGLLLWTERATLLPSSLPRARRLLLLGLTLALIGLFLPWKATAGSFVSGYTHRVTPQTGQLTSVYDPLATWVSADREPGRQLLGSLLPLFTWGLLLQLALGRPAHLRRLGPPVWLLLLAWWLLQRSILPGGLLYLSGMGLAGLPLVRAVTTRPTGAGRRVVDSCDWEG